MNAAKGFADYVGKYGWLYRSLLDDMRIDRPWSAEAVGEIESWRRAALPDEADVTARRLWRDPQSDEARQALRGPRLGGPWPMTPERDLLVWDMVWPLAPEFGNDWAKLDRSAPPASMWCRWTLAGDNHNVSQAMAMVAAARRHIFSRPDALLLVQGVADARRARRDGKLGVALHFEGTRCFERNLDMVEAFYALGVRHTLLAFNQTNSAGGGCAEAEDGGLSRFGKSLIAEMNRVGMLLDLSHTGRRTAMQAMEASAKPVVFTHSNSDAIQPHFRNVTDAMARACARHRRPCRRFGSSAYLAIRPPRPEAIFRHIDHFTALVGPEHVGLGWMWCSTRRV